MSRLDIFTVAIVAICIMAIIFLLYRTTDLFGGKDVVVEPPIEEVVDEEPEEDIIDPADYDPELAVDSTALAGEDEGEEEAEGMPASDEIPSEEQPAEGFEDLYDAGGGVGDYLVLAGSFEYRHNADNQAKRLKSLGYEAEVVLFNRGKYATVLVDRFDDMAAANALVTRLSGQNVEAYVHEKRGNR